MALDGIVLHQTILELNKFVPMKINRIRQASDYEYMFQTFSGGRLDLLISLHPNFSRIHFTKHRSKTNLGPTHLITLFKKHIEGGIITHIEQLGYDRIVNITIEHRDEMGVIKAYSLYLEFFGRYANMILLNQENIILDSFKRISDFENQDRIILPGVKYQAPESQNKKSFDLLETAEETQGLMTNFEGISPTLEKEIYHRLKNQTLLEIKEEILKSDTLFVYKKDFHTLELTHLNQHVRSYPIMEGYDAYFQSRQEQDRIQSHTQNMNKILRRELKKNKRKLNKLEIDYDLAQELEFLREYGDLLMTYASQDPAGKKEITMDDFEGNPQTISLEPSKSGMQNAQEYYKKYRKRKASRSHLEEQMQLAKESIVYFETLLQQIEQADLDDAFEIEEELVEYGLIKEKKKHQVRKKPKKRNYRTVQFDDDCLIYIGKNNIQNEDLSFNIANKEDYWFHAANAQGAHVIVKTDELTESRLRIAAQFAAYFSKNRYGSSVEVHYTQAKFIKKIPRAPKGMVQISNHKSMFIDPDEDLIMSYLSE